MTELLPSFAHLSDTLFKNKQTALETSKQLNSVFQVKDKIASVIKNLHFWKICIE